MAFPRPSLEQIIGRIVEDLSARLPGTDPRLRRSFVGAWATASGGAQHELYGYLAWLYLQANPATATGDALIAWAADWGLEPLDPVRAAGSVTVTGADGSDIPVGTVWRSGAPADYRSTAAAQIPAAGTVDVAVEAVEPGAAANIVDGTRLALVQPIAGVQSEAAAAGAIEGGADAESDERLRGRLLTRLQSPPRGGAPGDYITWAEDSSVDVTRVWESPRARGLGTVDVYFMTDDSTANGIPTAARVAAVQADINARAPVTADVDIIAPDPVALDITLDALDPDTAAVRAAIEAEIGVLVRRESEPGGTLLRTHISEAISRAEGEHDHDLVVPAADVVVQADEILVVGAFTYP